MTIHPPKLPPTCRRLIDLDAAIVRAIAHDLAAMRTVAASSDAERAGEKLLEQITGQRFRVKLEHPRD